MKKILQREKLYLLIGVLTLLLGCNSKPDPTVIVTIKEEFTVQMWENLAADDRSLQIRIETIESLDCENYEIDHTLANNSRKISIGINEIVRPDDCIVNEAPARLSVSLGYLLAGTTDFEINLSDNTVINKGLLTVSEDTYSLEMETKDGFRLLHPILNRVPRKTIWGSLQLDESMTETERADALKMIDEIKALSESRIYEKGYYGYFSIDADGDLNFEVESELPNPLAEPELFIFEYQDHHINEVSAILEYYRNIYPEQLEVKVWTWNGLVL